MGGHAIAVGATSSRHCGDGTIVDHVRFLLRLSVIVVLAGSGLATAAVAMLPAAQELAQANRNQVPEIDLGPLDQRSYVYAADGSVLAAFRAEVDRQPVSLTSIPGHTIDAVLAVEDAGFYIHDGVNLRATLRALVRNVDEGTTVQGGSTITQQLVKSELVGSDQTVDRKAREAVLARRLESTMTKDEILERYLNTVYFGNGAYGVQAGAETYFGIGVTDLDEAQSALLAGLIANPSYYDPIRHPDRARDRRNLALERMVAFGRLSNAAEAELRDQPLPTHITQVLPEPNSYFVEEVRKQLRDDRRLGDSTAEREALIFRGGLHIYTTLDPKAQALATQARDKVLADVSPPGTPAGTTPIAPDPDTGAPRSATAAVVSVEPSTGAIRAMVGGSGFSDESFNITTQGVGRSGGSSFKVFVLMALLENGYVPSDSVNGTGPCVFDHIAGLTKPYEVQNFADSLGALGTITDQTLRSSNCAYVRLGQIVGIDNVVAQARKMGITTALDPVVSMPLGTKEVHPLDMAAAFGTIAADGVRHAPYYIERVESRDGETLFEHRDDPTRAASPQSARLAAAILEANVRGGTGTRAAVPGQHAAGKTGTAQGSGDGWFVGFTPYLSTAVWIGAPGDRYEVRIRGSALTGGSYPAEIWGRYMRAWHAGLPERSFRAPGPTRAGKFLQLPPAVDPGGAADATTTTTVPLSIPDLPGFPPDFGGVPTLPPGFPGGPTTSTTQDRFPPGFPFDD
jgi:penicillin-binding protein 1A